MKPLKKHLLAIAIIAALLFVVRTEGKAASDFNAKQMYVGVRSVTLYSDTNKSSQSVAVPYRDRIYEIKTVFSNPSGEWIQVYYNRKILYYYKAADSNSLVESIPEPKYQGKTPWQQQVLDNLKFIIENWDTKYAHQSSMGVMDEDGKYGFDCSGLSAYVINKTMQTFVPTYRLSRSIVTLYESDVLYNLGVNGEFRAQTICEGVLDESKLEPGDILFFNLNTEENGEQHERGYNHCGIYIGDGEMIHSSHSFDGKVRIMPLTGIYNTKFVKARRYLPESISKIGELNYTTLTTTKIYEEKTVSSNVVSKVGLEVPVELLFTDINGTWAYVRMSDGKQGFVLSKYLCKSIREQGINCYVRGNLKLYRYLDTKREYRSVVKGTCMTFYGRVGAGNFYEVGYAGETYYIYATEGVEALISTGVILPDVA